MFTCHRDLEGLTWQCVYAGLQVTQDIYDDSRGQNSLLDGTVRRSPPSSRGNTAHLTHPTWLPKRPISTWCVEQRVRQLQDVPLQHEYSVRSIRAERQGRRTDPARDRGRIRPLVPPLEGTTSVVRLCSTSSNNPLTPLLSVHLARSLPYVMLFVTLSVKS